MKLVALVLAALVAAATPVRADDAHPWDDKWAGGFADGGDGVQVIVVGDQVLGFFIGGDYVDVTATDPIAADKSLTFRWEGSTATLGIDGGKRILTIRQDGVAKARAIPLTAD